eukprot:COSAG02_NODE_3160_length_7253_cov_17.821778_4_plen_263_part_01
MITLSPSDSAETSHRPDQGQRLGRQREGQQQLSDSNRAQTLLSFSIFPAVVRAARRYTRTINPLPPIRLGKRGKPKPQDWQRYWSARCAEIITLADDHVRRKKELRKVQGALKAALAKADMMEAEQLRRVIRENFSFDDIPDCNVTDPELDSVSSSNSNVAAVEQEIGEAPAVTTDATELLSSSSPDMDGEPMLTQVSDQGDSQATDVGDALEADGQARSSSESKLDSSTRAELAFDFNRSLEDGGGSGREVLERAPSRMNGV